MKYLLLVFSAMTLFCTPNNESSTRLPLLGISVSSTENREFSFTDKQSAYYYGRTHSLGKDWFSGWNVATEKIMSDYQLFINGQAVNRADASVIVYPNEIVRQYSWGKEIFRMFDKQKVLQIELSPSSESKYSIRILSEQFTFDRLPNNIAYFKSNHGKKRVLALSSADRKELSFSRTDQGVIIHVGINSQGFLIALDSSETAVNQLLDTASQKGSEWKLQRNSRMEKLLSDNFIRTSNGEIDHAVLWNILSVDALITEQTGHGIYAGLPWFNDYWGRDMFISLPGAALVTGQFDIARKILLSFAEYQNKDKNSKFYGRVPNRVRPDDIIYNTTDGTPRFIHALYEYIRYSGDTTLIQKLYPVIQRSIEGPIKYWVDGKGYLTHDDADTWMDAKWEGKIPWSPRGNRAVDIQSLWFDQLQAGIFFAQFMKNSSDENSWTIIQKKLQSNFEKDFLDTVSVQMADRLTKSNKPDFTVRPNQLFAYDLIENTDLKTNLTRKAWEGLVYPWGAASLSQFDPNFHPWHESDTYLHKDEAYHNGTVWLWNNGIAMQRMIESGQKNIAFELFRNMSNQTLHSEGAVGALSELTDALPHEGKSNIKLSGTFSQAWSSAEYLRVWYQFFLGIQPNAISKTVSMKPNIPDSLNHLDYHTVLFDGTLTGSFHRSDSTAKYAYSADSVSTDFSFVFTFEGYSPIILPAKNRETISIVLSPSSISFSVIDATGKNTETKLVRPNSADMELFKKQSGIMNGVRFAKPYLNKELDCLKADNKAKVEKRLKGK